MSTQADFIGWIGQIINDEEGKLTEETLVNCLSQAISEHSTRKPRMITEDVTADGTAFLPLPPSWDSEFSYIVRLEKLDSNNEPELMNYNHYRLISRPEPDGQILYFSTNEPLDGTTCRYEFATSHVIDVSSSSIAAQYEHILSILAASHACLRLATAYAQSIDQNIGTEVINFKQKNRDYEDLSSSLREQYDAEIPYGLNAIRQRSMPRASVRLFHS